MLSGSSYGRSIETVKFFLALYKAGIPVGIQDGQTLAKRLIGEDTIGIVPRSVMPWYCSGYFPGEDLLDFMNLPYESENEVIKAAQWKPVESHYLVSPNK